MSKTKKWSIVCFSLTAGILIAGYFGIPIIAEHVIQDAVDETKGVTVRQVSVRWGGPQLLRGVVVDTQQGSATLNVKIENTLLGLLIEDKPIKVSASGDAVLSIPEQGIPADPDLPMVEKQQKPTTGEEGSFQLPKLEIELDLASLTVDGENSLVYQQVRASLDVDPGRHFVASLTAETALGGSIELTCNAPTLITRAGTINPEASGSLRFTIENAQLPTINGAAGWSIIRLEGELSSPNMSESISVGATGSLAEYDQERGSIFVKTQLSKTVKSDAFTLGNWAIVGSVDISNVPTTILTPFLNTAHIDTIRDFGPTMDLKLSRTTENSPPVATFNTRDVRISGNVDPDNGVLSDVDIVAQIHNELLQTVTEGKLSGESTLRVHLERLVLIGVSENTLTGNMSLDGALKYTPQNTLLENFRAFMYADVVERVMATNGSVSIDGQPVTFDLSLRSPNKNKLDGIDDLWKTITEQLPRGEGDLVFKNVPTTLLEPYITDKRFSMSRDVGKHIDASANFRWDHIDTTVLSNNIQCNATFVLKGKNIIGLRKVDLTAAIDNRLATAVTGTNIAATSTLHVLADNVDFKGNAAFDITLDVGKQHTVMRGKTTRMTEGGVAGNLDLHMAATGIDVHLLDALGDCNGMLVDTLGSPIAVEIKATNILGVPRVTAGGTSPQAAFETTLMFSEGTVSTAVNTSTRAELQLSTKLTSRLLKDLGPVLSDIRSVKHPIQMTITHAKASLEGDLSKLHADVRIDIGEVALDSGSLTMQLLPMFNTKHVEVIPAYFDPIHIEIRNGIATYKEFRLTLANKYSIPYSGTIDLATRRLQLKSAVPLTGLGFSIKELRGLATDIDVPVLITGTIDKPVVDVDPSFDLGKLLLQSGIGTAIGEALDEVFGGNKKAPNPLDMIEELLKERN